MNQSLINELRGEAINSHRELRRIDEYRERTGNPGAFQRDYAELLLAKATALHAIAVLVAGK